MKKCLFTILLGLFLLSSCSNKPKKQEYMPPAIETEEIVPTKCNLSELLDDFLGKNWESFNNEVTRKKMAKNLLEQLGQKLKENPDFISDIPVQFTNLMDKGNGKYIVKFEHSQYNNCPDISTGFKVAFRIFSVINEEAANKLVDKRLYYIKGKYRGLVEDKVQLPSGSYFYDRPYVSYDSGVMGEGVKFDLGGLYFTEISF